MPQYVPTDQIVRGKVDAKGGLYSRGMAVLGTPGLLSKGNTYHVDSGHANTSDSNEGTDPDRPLATIDAAINKCTANNGDIILVSEGHSETILTDAAIDCDVAGITIVGLGTGSNRPTINVGATATGASTAATVEINAANVRIENILFVCGIDSLTKAIHVIGADFKLLNCEFRHTSTTKQMLIAVNIGAANNDADRAKIYGCLFTSPSAGAASAIKLAQLQDCVELVGNVIYGDYSDAGVHNPTGEVCTNLLIAENVISNLNSGNHAIELVSACTGILAHNFLYADAAATVLDPGSLKCLDNWGQHAIDAPAYPVPLAEVDVTTNPIGVNDADNAYDSSSVVANEDGSILERMEQLQEAVNVGSGTSLPANTSLADFVGKGTATQLAANESLVDLLYGANGISSFPNAAVPANNVSLAEVIRSIWAMLAGTAAGENGVTTWPAAAAPADTVSIAEAIRYIVETLFGTLANTGGTATLGGILGDVSNVSVATKLGAADGATTESLHGKLGTDTELADRSVYDILNGGGPAAAAAAAAPANDVSLYAGVRYIVETLIGTLVNAGGTATLGGMLGDFANDSLVARLDDVGSDVNGTTTDTLQGKLGTDTELADRSLYDILNGAGPAAAAAAAAPANDVSLYGVLRAIFDRQLGDGTNSNANGRLGKKVTKAAADIIDGTQKALFTVSGGRILLTGLSVETSAAAIAAGLCNVKFRTNPTVGTDMDLSANFDIDGDESGSLYSLSGIVTDATTGGSGGGAMAMQRPIIVAEGTIDLVSSSDGGSGGALGTSELWYVPLDDGASVAAA